MTLSIRQIEMFRADPDDLPEFLLTLHHQFGQQSDLLRVAKIGTQTVAGYGVTSATEARGNFCWTGLRSCLNCDARALAVGNGPRDGRGRK